MGLVGRYCTHIKAKRRTEEQQMSKFSDMGKIKRAIDGEGLGKRKINLLTTDEGVGLKIRLKTTDNADLVANICKKMFLPDVDMIVVGVDHILYYRDGECTS